MKKRFKVEFEFESENFDYSEGVKCIFNILFPHWEIKKIKEIKIKEKK